MASYKAFAFLGSAFLLVFVLAWFIKEELRRLNYKKTVNEENEEDEAGYYV